MPTPRKMSEKQTKQEILAEYNQLLAEIEGRPAGSISETAAAIVEKATSHVETARADIGRQLTDVSSQLVGATDRANEANAALEKEKRQLVELYREEKRQLELGMGRLKEEWEAEKQQQKMIRDREEDEYRYAVGIKHRQEQDEYQTTEAKRRQQIEERERQLLNREQEIATLEKEVTEYPAKLEVNIKQAKDELAKELIAKHALELRELKLIHEHERAIDATKIATLEARLQEQMQEIEHLKKQRLEATRQLQEMAVSVIESQGRAQALPKPEMNK